MTDSFRPVVTHITLKNAYDIQKTIWKDVK